MTEEAYYCTLCESWHRRWDKLFEPHVLDSDTFIGFAELPPLHPCPHGKGDYCIEMRDYDAQWDEEENDWFATNWSVTVHGKRFGVSMQDLGPLELGTLVREIRGIG